MTCLRVAWAERRASKETPGNLTSLLSCWGVRERKHGQGAGVDTGLQRNCPRVPFKAGGMGMGQWGRVLVLGRTEQVWGNCALGGEGWRLGVWRRVLPVWVTQWGWLWGSWGRPSLQSRCTQATYIPCQSSLGVPFLSTHIHGRPWGWLRRCLSSLAACQHSTRPELGEGKRGFLGSSWGQGEPQYRWGQLLLCRRQPREDKGTIAWARDRGDKRWRRI